ncbi:MAG: Rrf2 family transcriptional regulator [Chitinophagales bacterium]
MLSKKSQYGFQAAVYIACNETEDHLISPQEIAAAQGLPAPYLRKILNTLVKKKILISVKGPNGGFGLANAKEKIFLMQILLAIEGYEILNNCVLGFLECSSEHPCPFHNVYDGIRSNFYNFLGTTSLHVLCKDIDNQKSFISYLQLNK